MSDVRLQRFLAQAGVSSRRKGEELIAGGHVRVNGKVVTELEPAGPFWEAEPEHQDYLERIPNGYTCHYARPDWKLPKRTEGQRAAG